MKKVLIIVDNLDKDYNNLINDLVNKGNSCVLIPYEYNFIDIESDLLLIESSYDFETNKYTTKELNDIVDLKIKRVIEYVNKYKITAYIYKDLLIEKYTELSYEKEGVIYSNITIITDFYCNYNDSKYVAYIRDNRSFYVSRFLLKEGKMILLDIKDERVLNDLNIFSTSLKIVLGIVNKEQDLSSIAKTVLDNCGFIVDGDNPNLQSLRTVVSEEEKCVKIY